MPAITSLDLSNAKLDVDHIAAIATSLQPTATDRMGHTKDTISGAIYKIAAFTNRGVWASSTDYQVKDLVSVTVLSVTTWYVCVVQHTSSSSFSSDTSSKWRVYQGVTYGDLSSDTGSGLVGNGGETVRQSFDALQMNDYDTLRAYTGSRKAVYITGYLVGLSPSGIAGPFIADPHDTTSLDDSAITIIDATGMRWKRQFSGPIEVDWFGAFGVTDSKPAITAAIAVASTTPGGQHLAFRSGAEYTLLSGLTWDSTRVGFTGRGATLNGMAMTSGVFLAPTQGLIDDNLRVGLAQLHTFSDFRLRGPGFSVTSVSCVSIDCTSSETVNAGNTFMHCVFQGWAIDVVFKKGAFFTTFAYCNFQGIPGVGTDTTPGIQITNAFNAGERNIFDTCLFGGRQLVFDQTNPNADTFFNNCSFDYVGRTIMTISNGSVAIVGGHTEGSSDIATWYQVSGNDTLLTISPSHIISLAANKVNFPIFYCDDNCIRGGIIGRGWRIVGGSNSFSVRLVSGGGRTKIKDISHGLSTCAMLTSSFQNLLSYPSFESANFTSDWTLQGTQLPTRVNTVTAYEGSYCLEFAPLPSAGVVCRAVAEVDCNTGDMAACELFYFTSILAGTGGTFFADCAFTDKNGAVIGTSQQLVAVTGNVATWTKVNGGLPFAAPQGTRKFRIAVSLFGVTSGTPKGYIDAVSITIS